MLAKILNSNKTLDEKIDDLRQFSSRQDFLDALACSNDCALRDMIAFAKEVFAQYPPDSEFQLGPANDRRVFMIRLLTRLNYCNYCCVSSDAGVGAELMRLVYELLTRENIFNRYLSLKMLYPLLKLPIPIDFALHLKLINTFFHSELPQSDVDDPSKCELGFFIVSEVLKYLRKFQQTYLLDPCSYEGIFATLAATLHTYFRPHGLLDIYADNKKIMCEYSSAAIKLLDFINIFATAHTFYECVPDLCSTLAFRCPPDCYYLRKDAVRAIAETFSARPELFSSIEKYFVRSAFTSVRYVPLQVYVLDKLAGVIALFIRVDKGAVAFERDAPARSSLPHADLPRDMLYKNARAAKNRLPVLNKIVFSEFDARISEYLPHDNNPLLISACLSAYITNLSLLKICTMTPIELKTAVVRNLRHAYRVYQLLHGESVVLLNGACANDLLVHDILEDARQPPMASVLAKLIDYISLILQIIPMLHLPSGMLELEDLMILSKFILLPLNDYSGYCARGAAAGQLADSAYYRLFFSLPLDDFDYIMRSCAGDILIKYHGRADVWGVLTENFIANITLIRTANKLIHRDFVYGNYKHLEFYRCVFPVAYSFFKLDKKYFKSDFTELFNVTYQCALEMGLEDGWAIGGSDGRGSTAGGGRYAARYESRACAARRGTRAGHVNTKEVYDILNKMFLTIKACESAYTGLYFIYNNFEKSINELYDLYTLTNDLFYIECLFNIPVSLNLLVTKYSLLIRPMEVALRSTARLKEIVMKYIEYIIEFDNVSGMMDGLLIEVYKLLRYDDLKGMRVLSRISNIHRVALSRDEVKVVKLRDSHRITVPWDLKIRGREVEDVGDAGSVDCGSRGGAGPADVEMFTLHVNISLDKSVNSLIGGYIGCKFEHNFLQIRNNGMLETLYTRTLSMVEAGRTIKEPSRIYLLRYFLGMLGYSEYLRGVVDIPEEESSKGYSLNDIFVLSKEREDGLSYYAQYYVSVGDILLALYMDDSPMVRRILSGFMRSYVRYMLRSKQQTSSRYKVFVDVLVDGFVYAPDRAREMVLLFYRLLDEEYAGCSDGGDAPGSGNSLKLHEFKNRFVCERLHEIINLVYLDDDLKSMHALQAIKFYIETAEFYVDDKVCPVVMYALKYKLLRTRTYRMYELCVDLMIVLFCKFELRAREYYECVFNKDAASMGAGNGCMGGSMPGASIASTPTPASTPANPGPSAPASAGPLLTSYVRLLHCELEFIFNLNPLSDLPLELDRRSALRIIKLPRHILEKYNNLVVLTENLLKIIERTDSYAIKIYSTFISQMNCDSTKFNELLAPAKKYLPSVAVMEGFSSLESKRKFVETVNRNGHLQNNNPNSFRVFRNLFYNCQLAATIKTNFIEIYNNQIYNNDSKYISMEYRVVIYDILLYSRNYDIVTLDFLLTKIVDIVSGGGYGDILRIIYSRISASGGGPPADICRYLIEHIHLYHVYQLISAFIPFGSVSAHLIQWLTEYYYAAAASSLPNFADRMAQSKRAYCILRYLQSNGCRFENNRLILLIYRDLYNDYPSIMDLINWYFVGFTVDEIDLLYRINPSAVVDSAALLDKISAVEHEYLRVWLLYGLERRVCSDGAGLCCNNIKDVFTVARPIGFGRASRPTVASHYSDSSDSSGMDSLFMDNSNSEVSDILSYEPSLSDVSIDGSEDTGDADASSSVATEGSNSTPAASGNASAASGSVPAASGNAAAASSNAPAASGSTPNVSALVGLLSPLPLIEFFIKTSRRSDHVISLCRASIDNISLRYAALYYLCIFDPLPDYASLIFKLNFQERIYAVDSLLLLLDRFGVEMFIPTIKTVIRSEMRFMTSKHVILPLIIRRPVLVNNDELFFELCVMAYRLFSRMLIDYQLLALIESRSRGGGSRGGEASAASLCDSNIFAELNTLVILYEFTHANFRIFHDCRDFIFGRVLREVVKMSNNRKDDRHGARIDALFVYIDRHIGDSIVQPYKRELLELFASNLKINLTKEVVAWLFDLSADVGSANVSINTSNIMSMVEENSKNRRSNGAIDNATCNSLAMFLASTAANQIDLLELLLSINPLIPLVFDLLKELVRQKYSDADRFARSLVVLIDAMPSQVASWMLSDGAALAYPALAEYIADLIPRVDSMTAVSLCLLRFKCDRCGHASGGGCVCNGGGAGSTRVDLDTIYMTNYLHLFKYYSSVPPFRMEFYKGCASQNKVLRHSYMNLFYSQIPTYVYSTLEFVLKNDWKDVPNSTVDFMVAVALLRVLKLTRDSQRFTKPDYSTTSNSGRAGSSSSAGNAAGSASAGCNPLSADLYHIYRSTLHDPFDNLLDILYYCADSASFISNFLLVVFKILNHHSLQKLYVLFFSSNLTNRVKNCFIQAFDSRNISCGDIYFNPYNPSIRFYSNMGDRAMYYGMVKSLPALRETKIAVKLSLLGRHEQALARIYEVFRGVEKRTMSYKKEDLRILESELRYIYNEYDMSMARGSDGFKGVVVSKSASSKGAGTAGASKAGTASNASSASISASGVPANAETSPGSTPAVTSTQYDGIYALNDNIYVLHDKAHCFYSTFTEPSTIDDINHKFNILVGRVTQSEDTLPAREEICGMVDDLKNDLYVMCYIPRSSRVFSRLLMYATICSEINEALLILRDSHNDSIYGRFRMWMVRHPSFMADLVDWSLFMKWRIYIFNYALSYVPENDKKKISAEICKLTHLYASKTFKERLYGRTSYILNSINSISIIELQQNIQKYMLDIESLFASGEYTTMISLINSINVNRLSNEDRSRLYYWASRAFGRLHKMHESDKFGSLSRKIGDIMENKKEYLRMMRELIDGSSNGYGGSAASPGVSSTAQSGGASHASPGSTPMNGNINMQTLRCIYSSKLIEIINELPISESRVYMIDFIENGEFSKVEQIQPEKLYFFVPQLGRCVDYLMSNNLIRTSFNSIKIFEWLHGKQSGRWREYYGLKRRLAEYLDGSCDTADNNAASSNTAIGDINRLFDLELKYNFEINSCSLIMHTFDHPTALPGQFSYLRGEYENIKTMCYIEDFYSAYNEAEGIFFVRNMDGSISKVQLHAGTGADSADAGTSSDCRNGAPNSILHGAPTIVPDATSQLTELLNHNVKCHDLERAGFDISTTSRMGKATIHDKAYFSIDSVVKLQLFRKHVKYSSIALEYLRIRKEKQAGFARVALKWQDLLRRELVERLINSSDFYMFRNKLVNSYSSLIAVQYLLGTCDISLGGTFIEEVSGSVFIASDGRHGSGAGSVARTGSAAERFYLRPNIGYLFGNEGKNGPLILILSKFAEAYLSNSSNSSIVKFFLGKDKAIECSKRISRLLFDGVDEGCNSAELIVGEMVDPKTGLSMRPSDMAWI